MDTANPAPSSPDVVAGLCVAVGPLERSAERRLLSVLWGGAAEPLDSPAEGAMLVHVAMHGTRAPGSSAFGALGSVPRSERLMAALSHPDLSSADVDSARGAESLGHVRAVVHHPACAPSTVVRIAQAAASYGSTTSAAVGHFLATAAGPYGRAGSLVGSRFPHLSPELFVVLALEAGDLAPAEFEVFSTLLKDLPVGGSSRSGDHDLFATVTGLIDQARLVVE